MIRILDRYLIREIALPFCLGLVLLTFVLEIPPILRDAEALIAKGVEWRCHLQGAAAPCCRALALTIPMAVLLGILIGFGRVNSASNFSAQTWVPAVPSIRWPVMRSLRWPPADAPFEHVADAELLGDLSDVYCLAL